MTCPLVLGRRVVAPRLPLAAALMALAWLALSPASARAANSTITIIADSSTTDDSFVVEDNVNQNNGSNTTLKVKTTKDNKNRNTLMRVPLTGLAGRTVLQAWLNLKQASANNAEPIDARIYPLTESFRQKYVTWQDRDMNTVIIIPAPVPWTTPGGTHSPTWTDRVLLSPAGTGQSVPFQVGPIVQAWNSGAMSNDGFLIAPQRDDPSREVVFDSSDRSGNGHRPSLTILYTNSPPAVALAAAEIQPRTLHVAARSVPLAVWLYVDALTATPSGTPTGLNTLVLRHSGTLAIASIDTVTIGTATLPGSVVSWTDDGNAVTFNMPRASLRGRVKLSLRVDVLQPTAADDVSLPMLVDDSGTTGAGAQALWTGNSDNTAGNGDDWLLDVVATPAVTIDLKPDTAKVKNHACLQLTCTMKDAQGLAFSLPPDSVVVRPASAGSVGSDLKFCAGSAGPVQLIACYGALRDTSLLEVTPDLLPQVTGIELTDQYKNPATSLVPRDTMFANVTLIEGDGASDVSEIRFDVLHAAAAGVPGAPAYGASFRWVRGGTPAWDVLQPTGTSWQPVPDLCSFDSTSLVNGPLSARLAFVVGRSARASASGEWSIRARVSSVTPPSTADSTLTGLDVPVRWSLSSDDPTSNFSAGIPGSTRLPLGNPSDGRLHLQLETNTPVRLQARANDLVGKTDPLDTLRVDAGHGRLHESLTPLYDDGQDVGTAWVTLATLAPPDGEQPLVPSVGLWIDHPLTQPEQDYLGALELQLADTTGGAFIDGGSVELHASVVVAGLAASLALAEVTPHAVFAGTVGHAVAVYLLPLPDTGDTGIDRIRVGIPPGYGVPAVTAVTVAGSPVAFTDASTSGTAEALLATHVTSRQLIQLSVQVDAPIDVDLSGSAFVVGYDDQTTNIPVQNAIEGDANAQADGNNCIVRVLPGPLARITVTPHAAVVALGTDTTFTAAGFDAFGHPVPVTVSWRAEGGMGTISSISGSFDASAAGAGRVIATSGSLADTAAVTVVPPAGVSVRAVYGPAQVVQGQAGVTFGVRVENTAAGVVALDTLRLVFGRAVPGDADPDFTVTVISPVPYLLPAGAAAVVTFEASVDLDAIVAPLSVQAMVSGIESGSGERRRDTVADSALALDVRPGGATITAHQTPAVVRPGSPRVVLLTLDVANQYPDPRGIERLVVTNRTTGPGDQDQRDDELGKVGLYRDDGDGAFDAKRDTLQQQNAAFNGKLSFWPINTWLAPAATTRLFVVADLPVPMRDGDVLDLELASDASIEVSPATAFRNAWPVTAPGGLTVDGMSAAQVALGAVGPGTVGPGARDRLVLDALLPANGYTADVLTRLGVSNEGSARAVDDIERLRAWADDGDGVFSPATDPLLGTLAYTGGARWQLTGLARPVPVGGARVFVSADVTPAAVENATLRLSLPVYGVGMTSGNSGPVDLPVTNAAPLSVSNANRVALAALATPGGTARPDERRLALLALTATNTYAVDHTLTRLVFDDATTGPGTQAERDGESRLLTLRIDGDDDGTLDGTDEDPVLGSGFFQAGRATFAGLSVPLPPGATRLLFLTADLSPTGARDGDVVGATITGVNSVDFAEATTVAAVWPLDSGARWTIDGFTAAQLTNFGAPGATVGPGDGPVPALDVVVPPNGYAADLLRGIRVVNLGTAGAADLTQVELWRDGGDGAFGGDDSLLGPLTWTGADWTSPLLSTPVSGLGARLFVSVHIAPAAAETTTVQFAIPEGGLEYDSDNDGPVDAAVVNPEPILISASPLLATLSLPHGSTVGQAVPVMLVVRNTGAETVNGVTAPSLDLTGSASFAYVSGPVPATVDLAPGASDTLVWNTVAQGVGDARFAASAGGTGSPSGLPRNAPRATSNAHHVFVAAQQLDLTAVQTMPIHVNRGQTGVVPFSLTLTHPGGVDASDVRVDRIRIRLEEESGAPIVPVALLDRVEVNEGTNVYLSKTALETSGSEIDLQLATPVTVTSAQPATISLRLDVDSATVVPTFRVVIDDSTRLEALDATSSAPVTVHLSGAGYPLRSDAASVVAEATELTVLALPPDTVRTSRGLPGATLLGTRLESPGIAGISSNAHVASLAVALTDSAGADVANPGAVFAALRLNAGAQVLASRTLTAGDGDSIVLAFTPPLELAANAELDVTLVGDVAAAAPFGRYGVRLLDSTWVDAHDADTHTPLPVHYTPADVRGGVVAIEAPADTLRARGEPVLPATVVIGETDVPAITATLRHPGLPGVARLRVDGLTLECLDDLRRPVVPRDVLRRVSITWNDSIVAEVTALPGTGDLVPVALPGLLLEPGDSARVEVRIDVDAAAPAGFLELVVPADALSVSDANTLVPATLAAEAGASLPLHSGLGRLASPARDLAVGLVSLMPATLAGDGRAVAVARFTLRNTDAQGGGAIDVDHLVFQAGDRVFAAASIGSVATRLEAWVDGVLWGQSATLTPDSATAFVSAPARLTLGPGATTALELRWITRPGLTTAGVRLGLDRPGVGVVQPASALLAIDVGPEAGLAFPMWTEAGVMSSTDLEASYVNYPNPFAAGREATTVAYYMPAPGRVTLRVMTARGEPVATLLDGVPRSAGQQLGDHWDGRNGRGGVVVNGVYVAELDIRFDDGQQRRLRRKLAVVR